MITYSAAHTDQYQLTMEQSYFLKGRMEKAAVFGLCRAQGLGGTQKGNLFWRINSYYSNLNENRSASFNTNLNRIISPSRKDRSLPFSQVTFRSMVSP